MSEDFSAPTSPSPAHKLPVVSIVGRPNVGKSSLFNRILRRRMAIVDPTSGVTRDVIRHETEWEGKAFLLEDTAGITFDKADGEPLEKTVQRQTRRAVEEADFLILAADLKDGLTPLDLMVFEMLRKAGKPFCLALNKSDNDTLQMNAGEFARLGADTPAFCVSALHGTGLYSLLDCVVKNLKSAPPRKTGQERLTITIAGKPNVGKSSLMNRLLNKERVLVDNRPGTTRDSVDADYVYRGRAMTLIDTAGMRKEKRVADAIEKYSMIRTEESIKRAEAVLVLMDTTLGVTQQDRRILHMVESFFKACLIAVNKWDLVSGKTMRTFTQEIFDQMGTFRHVPVLFISAKTGLNVKKCMDTLVSVCDEYRKSIPTPRLNRFIKRLTEQQPPPLVSGKRLKIYYAAQTQTRPPAIEFFINSRKSAQPTYMRHILNEIRAEFGFAGVPIKFLYKEKAKRPKDMDTRPDVGKNRPRRAMPKTF